MTLTSWNSGSWVDAGTWRPRWVWEGPEQAEDRSPENIRQCYRFLRSRPYLTKEDRERLERLEVIAVAEALMTDGSR